MALNYAHQLPHDKGSGEAMQDFPAPRRPVARVTSENATTSSVITLNDQTVQLEVAAVGVSAAMRWVTTGDTEASIVTIAGATSNYDHIIPAGTVRRFVVPQETPAITSIAGANIMNGLYQRVAYRSMGIGSVLTTQY